MPNLNRVFIMGNLTRDPEMRYTPSNTAIVQIGIAINRTWKNQAGEKQEEVTFIDAEAWQKTAETINQYFQKGDPIFIEGRLKLDQWEDKEGQKRSKIKVVIENFQFIKSKSGEQGGSEEQPPARTGGYGPQGNKALNQPKQRSTQTVGGGTRGGDAHQPVEEEDIPF